MSSHESRPGPRRDRPPRMVKPKQHDTYAREAKSRGALVCDECGVVNHGGRWYWGAPPLAEVHGGLCPACERIRDRYPAGTIRLPAELAPHREELLGLIRNAETAEKAEHPLERLMEIDESTDQLVVTTTGIHLARRIAGALGRRFKGKLAVRYLEEQNLIHVDWKE